MPSRDFPNIGLKGGYLPGETDWGDEMNANLLKLSTYTQGRVLDIVSSEPTAPAQGDVYIIETTGEIVAYDDSAWVTFQPLEGLSFYNLADHKQYRFDGSAWSEVTSGSGGTSSPITYDGEPITSISAGDNITLTLTDGNLEIVGEAGGSGGGGGSGYKVPKAADFTINPLAAVISDGDHALRVQSASTSGGVYATMKDVSAQNFVSMIAKISPLLNNSNNTAGLTFRNTDGKYVTFDLYNQNGLVRLTFDNWSNATTYSSGNLTNQVYAANADVWLRLDYDRATGIVTAYFSGSGDNWYPIGTAAYLGTTVDAAGLFVAQNDSNYKAASWVQHFEISNAAITSADYSFGGGGSGNWWSGKAVPKAADFASDSSDSTAVVLLDDDDVGLMVQPGVVNGNPLARNAVRSIPGGSSDWTITARMDVLTWRYDIRIGLMVYDSATGHMASAFYSHDSNANSAGAMWGTDKTGSGFTNVFNAQYIDPTFNWYQIENDSGTLYFRISKDGKNWITLGSVAYSTAFSSGPDKAGFWIRAGNSGLAMPTVVTCDYFAVE